MRIYMYVFVIVTVSKIGRAMKFDQICNFDCYRKKMWHYLGARFVSIIHWYDKLKKWYEAYCKLAISFQYRKGTSIQQAPVFGTSEHYGKANGSLLSRLMNYNYTACCWFATSNNILILPSQFWQISFESYWSHCSKYRMLVLLRYHIFKLAS